MVTGELKGKNIKITVDLWERLVELKHGNDTFTDVIERLVEKKHET